MSKDELIVVYTARARKDLKKIQAVDRKNILTKISHYTHSGEPLANAKPLKGEFLNCYRYRIGNYRAIFHVHTDGTVTLLTILTIGHRKEVYR